MAQRLITLEARLKLMAMRLPTPQEVINRQLQMAFADTRVLTQQARCIGDQGHLAHLAAQTALSQQHRNRLGDVADQRRELRLSAHRLQPMFRLCPLQCRAPRQLLQ
ncbi:hypothetical protein D3C71_1302860 [compost metagenome]